MIQFRHLLQTVAGMSWILQSCVEQSSHPTMVLVRGRARTIRLRLNLVWSGLSCTLELAH
jgi:hypothetical protein